MSLSARRPLLSGAPVASGPPPALGGRWCCKGPRRRAALVHQRETQVPHMTRVRSTRSDVGDATGPFSVHGAPVSLLPGRPAGPGGEPARPSSPRGRRLAPRRRRRRRPRARETGLSGAVDRAPAPILPARPLPPPVTLLRRPLLRGEDGSRTSPLRVGRTGWALKRLCASA